MKKVFKLENLGCANCAAKMEREINKLDGVNNATVNFFTQKLTIDSTDYGFENIMSTVEKIIKKNESSCSIKM